MTTKKQPKKAVAAPKPVNEPKPPKNPVAPPPKVATAEKGQEGTAPGLPQKSVKEKTVNMKCRADNCDSMEAVVAMDSGHNRMYRCVKCGRPMGAAVGGHINV